jgi:chromosome segregation protein
MRIKRLEIMGFKSFPERVQVGLPAGISAVVGPNGCGKSNIVDAIRWVMGEQSPKQLRGRNMDDVLFNGAKSFQPSGLAEVTMVLSNENGNGHHTSLGPSEISITRRLYRSGDSEYLINKVPCRLKDITQFFMDTGMGTKAYAIIEQGRIGWLVDARPEDRRALLDEAAGITRYKAQKREAERKIESTEQNLQHVEALMAETKRQIISMTRAANKAVRYKEFKKELQDLDLALTHIELTALNQERTGISSQKQEQEAKLTVLLARLEQLEVEVEETRLRIVEQEKESEVRVETYGELTTRFGKLRQEADFLERQVRDNRERQTQLEEDLRRLGEQSREKQAELARLEEALIGVKAQAEEKRSAREEIKASVAELRREHDLASGRRDELTARLAELARRHARLEESLAGQARMSENHAQRREALEVEAEGLRGESGRVREEVQNLENRGQSIRQRVQEAVGTVQSHKDQLDRLQSEIAERTRMERRADSDLAALQSRLSTLKDVQDNFGWYPQAVKAVMGSPELRAEGVLGPVAERLNVPSGYEMAVESALGERLQYVLVRDRRAAAKAIEFLKQGDLGRCGFIAMSDLGYAAQTDLIRALLGEYTLCDSLTQALEVPTGRTVLTRQGECFGPGGVIVGGPVGKADQGVLARLKSIEDLKAQVEEKEREKENLARMTSELEVRMAELRRAVNAAEQSLSADREALTDVEKQQSGLSARLGEINGRLESVTRNLGKLDEEANRLEEEKEAIFEQRQMLEAEEFDLNADLESARERADVLSDELEEIREQEQRAAEEQSALNERLATSQRAVQQTSDWLKDIETQKASKQAEMEKIGHERTNVSQRRESVLESLEGSDEKLAQAQQAVQEQKKLVDELRVASNEKEHEARQARRSQQELSDQTHKLETSLQEVNYKVRFLMERIQSDYGLDMNNLPEDMKPGDLTEFDTDDAKARRDDLKSKIEAMGEVNPTAVEEHDALKERYDFYKTQYDDLQGAIENLKSSIQRINRTCKVRFQSTFEAVDQKLREIFPLLFEGGEAWLSLTDDTDPLESGVEIHVHPPGKRLTVMSLLSGGEKALVALALIFALYLIKPSPFCLLDETDAPLDEANIDRFNRLLTKLGQSSQIIMVTHNKRTMQISETLYGVTMEEPGVSKLVSVNLADVEELEEHAEMVQAG